MGMTKLFDKAVERIRALSAEEQDELARILLRLVGEDEEVYQLTAEEEADLIKADEEIARGEFATDDQMAAIWAKHGL